MANHTLIRIAAPKTYAELKRGVDETLLAGQRRIEMAKVLTYWETGRLINAHVLLNGGRATGRDVEVARCFSPRSGKLQIPSTKLH